MTEGNVVKKVFVIIGMVLLGIILCYFSVAVYFYFARPNDITGKLSVFNVLSDDEIGEIYLEASYSVRYGDEDFLGVNVDESGYVVTFSRNFDEYDGEEILLYHSSGDVFDGEIVFQNDALNLAILKLYDHFDVTSSLSLPYVKTGDLNTSIFSSGYLAVGDPFSENNINKAKSVKYNTGYVTKTYDEIDVVDFVVPNSISFVVDNYKTTSQGAIFDKSGKLVGLSYAYAVNDDNINSADYYAVATKNVGVIVERLKDNTLCDFEIRGLDMDEISIRLKYKLNENQIFYDDGWLTLSDSVLTKYLSRDGVLLLEDFAVGDSTLLSNHIITSISYNGYSKNVTTLCDLFNVLYSLEEGTTFSLNSIDILTDKIVKTTFKV